jgi:predicted PurR-regulated permease PerM
MPRIVPETVSLIVITVIALAVLVIYWRIAEMVVLGASLAVVLMPLHHRICRHTRDFTSAAIITIAVFFVMTGFVYVTVTILTANAGVMSEMFITIGNWLEDPMTNPAVYGIPFERSDLSAILAKGNALFSHSLATIFNNLTEVVVYLIVFFVSFYLLLLKGEELKNRILTRLPVSVQKHIPQIDRVTVDTLYALYIVQIAIAVLTFFIAIPVFYFLGYGNVLFYSFLAAFCELIPILGSSVAFIIIGAYALALGDIRGVFILFIFGYLIVSLIPEVYVRPALVGRRVKIHWLIMFIGIVGGIVTMGLAGFVLGPLIIVLLVTWYRIWKTERIIQARQPEEINNDQTNVSGHNKTE